MCVVLTGIQIAMIVGGTLAATAGVMMKEEAAANQRKMANYQSRVAESQALSAQYEAENARKLAKYDAANLRREFLRAQGEQRSLLAMGGAQMTDGSAMDVLLDNAAQARRDQEFRLYQGELDAWRATNQANSLLADAGAGKMQAAASRVSGWTYAQTAASTASSSFGMMGA